MDFGSDTSGSAAGGAGIARELAALDYGIIGVHVLISAGARQDSRACAQSRTY